MWTLITKKSYVQLSDFNLCMYSTRWLIHYEHKRIVQYTVNVDDPDLRDCRV